MTTTNISEATLFHGIVDCHGIESFHQHGERDEVLRRIRADHNAQRHACYFQVDISTDDRLHMENLLKRSDWQGACQWLKTIDGARFFGPGKIGLLPNPDIDPYYSNEEEKDN